MSNKNRFWLRVGDIDNYEHYDNLGEVAEAMRNLYGWGEGEAALSNVRQIAGGFQADGFEDKNYISLYWGDEKSNLIRSLTHKEFVTLIEDVNRATFVRDRLNEMPNPNDVGQSEYRIIHEFVSELIEQMEDDDHTSEAKCAAIRDSMDEIINACRTFKNKFEKPY